MQHIQKLALKEKLASGPARDLANYIRLLDDLQDLEDRVKAEAKKRLEAMPIEELEARAKELLSKRSPVNFQVGATKTFGPGTPMGEAIVTKVDTKKKVITIKGKK